MTAIDTAIAALEQVCKAVSFGANLDNPQPDSFIVLTVLLDLLDLLGRQALLALLDLLDLLDLLALLGLLVLLALLDLLDLPEQTAFRQLQP